MNRARTIRIAFYSFWIAGVVTLFSAHFLHILADFPNHSPWMDYSKYTDEGWYASAAVRYCLTSQWFLPGDFNPAVALPIWPLLLAALFHFSGVSLSAARILALIVFGANLALSYAIIRSRAPRWCALLAVTILVANPFLYAFSRLAILEPLLMLLVLISWYLSLRLPTFRPGGEKVILAIIGLLLCLAVLTKTTAVFMLPSALLLIANSYGFRLRASARALGIAASAGLISWIAWYSLFVLPHYRADFQYLFAANRWPQPATPAAWLRDFWYAFHGSLWISPPLCITAAVLLLLTLLPPRRKSDAGGSQDLFWRDPVLRASLLLTAGYVLFIAWHNNSQPRYYLPVVYPLAFILVLATHHLCADGKPGWRRAAGAAGILILAAICLSGALTIGGYLRHPEYSWFRAAENLTRYIRSHDASGHLLLAVSGADISLMTHLPTICDEYGTWDLTRRIRVYRPGWYAAWNEVDPATLAKLQTQYSLQRVTAFPAFDDPDRNLLILYRLRPLASSDCRRKLEMPVHTSK